MGVLGVLGILTADRWDMMDEGGHRAWGVVVMILLVVLVGLGVWAVARATQPRRPHPHDRAREILAERLARGEITPEDYSERIQHLA